MAELVANQGKMSEMQSHIISGLANLIESRDTDTGEHVTRTSILKIYPKITCSVVAVEAIWFYL